MHAFSKIVSATAALSLLSSVSAWLPHDNLARLEARDGSNLFNNTKRDLEGRWTPGTLPIRGVNLGSQFVVEPWMASQEWQSMGCGSYNSEFDCVSALGQEAANTVFQNHWGSWITQDDIKQMQAYGLNAIRIPLGYWLDESIVDTSSEHFPQGAIPYLRNICEWASGLGFYIVLDLHGAPYAQQAQQPFTGQYASNPGFYQTTQYDRALEFLEFLVEEVHTNNQYRNVGMIELVNEPLQVQNDETTSMRQYYYQSAWNRVHHKEDDLGVHGDAQLHLLVMNNNWGSGNPTEWMNGWNVAYDDHRYLKYDTSVPQDQASYLSASCNDKSQSDTPGIVGEFSISSPNDAWDPASNKDFYTKWFAAQVSTYESTNLGWFFWSWKTQLGDDYRWSYSQAVQAGVIPTNPANVDRSAACS